MWPIQRDQAGEMKRKLVDDDVDNNKNDYDKIER